MSVELINPEGLADPEGFAHVGVATGSRLVFMAGQVGRTADGTLGGNGDLAGQAEQALLNVATGLEAAGASFSDVSHLRLYVVDWDPGMTEALFAGLGAAAQQLGIDPTRPSTLIGVASLFEPELLIEIEATAVVE